MSAFSGPNAPEKLCLNCYAERFPGKPVGTLTWARECTQCHKPTPSLSTLVKVERVPESDIAAKTIPENVTP